MNYLLTFSFLVFSLFINAQDSVLILSDEKMALECKLSIMQHASKSISFSYYAINEDEVGLKFAAMACMKADEGIPVKIIIERSRSKVSEQLIQIFRKHGIDIRYYNSFHVRKTYKNFSWLHDKLLVVDSLYVVLGGRNLNNKYYPNTEKPIELVDIETLFKSKPGEYAQDYIHHLFSSRYSNKIKTLKPDTLYYNKLQMQILKYIQLYKEYPYKDYTSILEPVNNAEFIHDDYSKWPKSKTISNRIFKELSSAKKSIVAASPYLIPPIKYMRVLKKAASNNISVTLLSNSAQVSDAKIIAAAYMNDYRKYLKKGIKVFEYNGEKMLHDKLFLIDDSISIVGSYNFDNISYRMNSEVIAVVADSNFSNKIKKHIASRLTESLQITKRNQVNPYNDKSIQRRTKWNRVLLYAVPFIRRFL